MRSLIPSKSLDQSELEQQSLDELIHCTGWKGKEWADTLDDVLEEEASALPYLVVFEWSWSKL